DQIWKFVNEPKRELLLLEPEQGRNGQIRDLVSGPDVDITSVQTGEAALAALRKGSFDCAILAPQPPAISLATLAEQISVDAALRTCPQLLYIGPHIADEEVSHWNRLAQEFGLRPIDSPESLADQTALALCRNVPKLSESCRKMVQDLADPAAVLAGKKVLI